MQCNLDKVCSIGYTDFGCMSFSLAGTYFCNIYKNAAEEVSRYRRPNSCGVLRCTDMLLEVRDETYTLLVYSWIICSRSVYVLTY